MKNRVKELTQRNDGKGYDKKKLNLKQFITGWVQYFKLAQMKTLMREVDQWMRKRIRMGIWKQWKKVRTRYAMLKKLGATENNARILAFTRKGYWRIASSPILHSAITNDKLKKAGYFSFF